MSEIKIGWATSEHKRCIPTCLLLFLVVVMCGIYLFVSGAKRVAHTVSDIDTAIHKTMSLSVPVHFTLPDKLSEWFWSCRRVEVMPDVSFSLGFGAALPHFLLFQTSECGDCCTRSAVGEDYWTGLHWSKRLPWPGWAYWFHFWVTERSTVINLEIILTLYLTWIVRKLSIQCWWLFLYCTDLAKETEWSIINYI